MFQITWKEYLIFLGGALVVYYLYIALAYYRKEIMALLRGGGSPDTPPPPSTINLARKKKIWQVYEEPADAPSFSPENQDKVSSIPDPASRPFAPAPQDEMSPLLEDDEDEPLPIAALDDAYTDEDNEVTPEMEALQHMVNAIREAFTAQQAPVDKQKLLAAIQQELASFPYLNAQPYKIAIQNLITAEARERFELSITERELETIWPEQTG